MGNLLCRGSCPALRADKTTEKVASPARSRPSVLVRALRDLLGELLHDRGVAQRGDVAELASLGDVAQQAAHDLAASGLRQVLRPDDPLRPRQLPDPGGDQLAD